VRRLPERGRYDRETVHAILDEGLVAHVGFLDQGRPVVVPMAYGRAGESLLLHAASSSRVARVLAAGADCCVAVTLLDGLVLARSAFHHSMNYRSVVLFGRAAAVVDREEKLAGLEALVEHLAPGRWDSLRPVHEKELHATALLRLPLQEASAKIRTGPPKDDEEDLSFPVWAGVVPLSLSPGTPEGDPFLLPGQPAPTYARSHRRSRG
jgi:hypothetical protein